MKRNVKILGRRSHSASLKDIACLEDVQLIFLIFHTFVCKSGMVDKLLHAVRGKNVQTNVWKISSATSSTPTSFKLGKNNLLLSILTF